MFLKSILNYQTAIQQPTIHLICTEITNLSSKFLAVQNQEIGQNCCVLWDRALKIRSLIESN